MRTAAGFATHYYRADRQPFQSRIEVVDRDLESVLVSLEVGSRRRFGRHYLEPLGSRSDRNIPSWRCVVRFTDRMVPEVFQTFWAAMARGEFITDAAAEAGTYRRKGAGWLAEAGGVPPRRGRDLKGRCLTMAEREEIALARARGESMRDIAGSIGRSPSTISRELARNTDGLGRYRATSAHAMAYARASRPKPAKLATNQQLRDKVEADLAKKYSPEQIAGRLKVDYPGSAGDAGEHRNDLPIAVRAVPRRPETGPDQVFEDRSGGP